MKKLIALFFLSICLIALPGTAAWAEDDEEMKGLKKLCEEKNDSACFRIGEKFRILERDNKTALEYYLKACDTGHLDGCTYAGILTAAKGKQYSPEWKKAAELFQRTCDQNQEMGCFNLGALKYKEGRQKAAIKYFKKACDLGHQTACSNLKNLEN